MATWLRITLDTTSPLVDLYMPTATTYESYEDIFLVANEDLDIKHEFYIVDSLNQKHNFTLALEKDEKKFHGRISFHAFPKGIATAYFRVYDKVWNSSAILTKSFAIVDPQNIKMFLSEHTYDVETFVITRNLNESVKENKITLNESIMNTTISDKLEEGEA